MFTKTIKLRLKELTRNKEERIQEAMKQSLKCANKASERLPSLNFSDIENRSNTIYNIVKDLRNNGINLSASCAYQSVQKAKESYLSKVANGEYETLPKYKRKFLRLHNRDDIGGFFKKNGTYYVTLKLFPYEKIHLLFYHGDYQEYFLEKLVNGEMNYGSAEIKKYDYGYSFNITIKKEVDVDYEPKTFIGIDLGLNILAWVVATDKSGEFLDEIHFSGGEAGWVRDRYFKKRQRLQREGQIKLEKKIGNKEQRWMENKNHVISRRIVEFAEQFDKPIIIMEDIDGKEIRKGVDNPTIHNWTFGNLRNFIEYKAKENSIKTKEINPEFTSQKCPKCGYTDKENRDGIEFKCQECGYKNHSDFVGALNIRESD